MDDRQKFRDLVNKIPSLMEAKSTGEVSHVTTESNEASESDEKLVTRNELLNVLQSIYETCCDEISINISPVCEKITCQNEYCVRQNKESRLHERDSLGKDIFDEDFSGYSLTSQNTNSTNVAGCQILKNEFDPRYDNPIAIIVYDPGLESNNRCQRIKRLKSRRIRKQRGVNKAQLT